MAVLLIGLVDCSFAWAAAPGVNLPAGLAPAFGQALAPQLPAAWQAKPVRGGAAFSNPAERLQARLDGRGLHLHLPGKAAVDLQLVGYRQGLVQAALHTQDPVPKGTRISRELGAGLSEWYVNSPLGIEQGFTLLHPLATHGSVVLRFSVQGPLTAVLKGGGLMFQDAQGKPVIWYGDLLAFDAGHRPLPAHIALAGRRLTLSVDTHGARYPVTLDPLFSTTKALHEPDPAAGDQFGYSVALSADGETALVGADNVSVNGNGGAGKAYVFKAVNGVWSATPAATFSDPIAASLDVFGGSVALSADGATALIGAYGTSLNGISDSGQAYVFKAVNGAWSKTPVATIPDPAPAGGSAFGFGVTLSADGASAVIGAPNTAVNGNSVAGEAYVYRAQNGVWSTTPSMSIPDPLAAASDAFGTGVALSADGATALVGAVGTTVNGNGGAGKAYVFKAVNGIWSTTPAASFSDPIAAANDYFGRSVALSADGDSALIGAFRTAVNGQSLVGLAYLFERTNGVWSATPVTFRDPAAAANDLFGFSVALSADGAIVLIGANGTTVNGTPAAGKAYVFKVANGSWSKITDFSDPTTGTNGSFGYSVALSSDGGTALIGARNMAVNGFSGAGQAYVFASPVNLSLALHSNPASISMGQDAAFMVTITNTDATAAASNLVLTDTLPAGMSYVSSSPAGGSCSSSNGKVTCTLASLAPGATWQPSITMKSTSAGSFQDSASIGSGDPDPSLGNNTASTSVTVKSVTPPPAPPAGGGSSGGGAMGLLSLGLLGLLLRYRRSLGQATQVHGRL